MSSTVAFAPTAYPFSAQVASLLDGDEIAPIGGFPQGATILAVAPGPLGFAVSLRGRVDSTEVVHYGESAWLTVVDSAWGEFR